MKNRFLILFLIVLLLLSGCRKKAKTDAVLPSESNAAINAAVETTEETIPGVMKNIFDANGELTVEITEPPVTVPKVPAQTVPTATIPKGPSGSGSGSGGDGLHDPDPPEDPDITAPTKAPDPTQPPETQPTQPAETQPAPTEPQEMDYEAYHAMSPAQQQAYMESFESMEAFFVWYENAKQEHDKANPPIDVGSGSIDLGDIINDNNG